ncbi:response regulator with CheY-like receiver domain and winged-helix DNA-binding domain [Thiovulum sp. ES]|nr:response regulator with CheY-like receiver domain and winged-helix DNA-binding domain [Thiovulum sp. ES]
MKKSKILVIDDDKDLLELLDFLLKKEGYRVTALPDSKQVHTFLYDGDFSLMIVDRNLPCVEGTEFVEQLRKSGDKTPVIFLTAKNSKEEKLEGFSRGGDDYITKPFDNDELLMRVEAILRRTGKIGFNNTMTHRDISINLEKYEVKIGSDEVKLTKLEFKLLQVFMENIGNVLNRDYLLDVVWNCGVFDEHCNEKSVNVAVKRLKSKIDEDGSKKYIESVRGIGYKLR